MISLTRLNGSPIYLNSDLIKYAEASPDTMLTLIHGEKMVVLESCEEVVERLRDHRIRILRAVAESLPGAVDRQSAAAAGSARSAFDHVVAERKENTGERKENTAERRESTAPDDPAAIYRRRAQQF